MIALIRVDDRLVHAQVVVGWGMALRPDRFLVADDEVAASSWETGLYAAASPDVKVNVLSVDDAAAQLVQGVFDREKVVILLRHPRAALRLMDQGVEIRELNVGGLHFKAGKEKLLENVYLDAGEREALRELVKRGVTLEARAVPSSEYVKLNARVV